MMEQDQDLDSFQIIVMHLSRTIFLSTYVENKNGTILSTINNDGEVLMSSHI